MLRAAGFAVLCEVPLPNGRRADIVAINHQGRIHIVEIKSSPADYRADGKWHEYWGYCDRLYFAIPPDMAPGIIAPEVGLIVADAWGAETLRQPEERPLAGARRRAVTLAFARLAALRLHNIHDPNAEAAI